MKQLLKIGLFLIFSTCSLTVLFAQVADALVITPEGNVQVPAGNLDVKGNITTAGNLDVKGNVTTAGNINTNGKLMENGNALLPKGAIIMWNGDKVPAGWALCDGFLYVKEAGKTEYIKVEKKDEGKYTNESDKIRTPDLSGRFVVGAGSNEESTYNLTAIGGSDRITLTTDQMPNHTHALNINGSRVLSATAYQRDKDSGMGATHSVYDTGSDKEVRTLASSITINSSGNNQSFDNRPKYYALYYIMKL
jgi:microcystin-dependent protein